MNLEVTDYKNIGRLCEDAYNSLCGVFDSFNKLNRDWDINELVSNEREELVNCLLFLSDIVCCLGNIEASRTIKVKARTAQKEKLVALNKQVEQYESMLKNMDSINYDLGKLNSFGDSLKRQIHECDMSLKSLNDDKVTVNDNILNKK